MWENIRRLFGKHPSRAADVEQWVISQAQTVSTLVKLQLKEVALAPIDAWRTRRPALLGYTCGMTEHVCAKLELRKNASGIAFMALADIVGAEVSFDEILAACTSLQHEQNVVYIEAHKIGWHDLGTLSPAGLPKGLAQFLV